MRIGRIAGQYAKPRSSSYEKVGDTQVLSFRYVIFFLSPVPRTLLSSPLSDILPMAALYLQGAIMLTGIVFFFNLPQSVSSKTLLVWILTTVPRIPIVCLGTHKLLWQFFMVLNPNLWQCLLPFCCNSQLYSRPFNLWFCFTSSASWLVFESRPFPIFAVSYLGLFFIASP